jgi:hypothetical protein
MKAADVMSLSSTLGALGDASGKQMVLRWLQLQPSAGRRAMRVWDVLSTAQALGRSRKAEMAKVLEDLESSNLANPPKDQRGRVIAHGTLSQAWLAVGDSVRAKRAAMRCYHEAVGTEDARAETTHMNLDMVAETFQMLDLIGEDKGYVGYAHALARLAREGKLPPGRPWHLCRLLAMPLGTKQTREVLEAELLDASGTPRLQVAAMLAWVYRRAGKLRAWIARVDAEIDKTAGQHDLQAMWLLARGHAAATMATRGDPQRAVPWLRRAMAVARSDPARLAVFREMTVFYEQLKWCRTGADILQSVRHQFSGESLAEIDALAARLRAGHERNLAAYAAAQVRRRGAQQRALLRYYRKCLAAAQSAKDGPKIAKLQAALAELEAPVAP